MHRLDPAETFTPVLEKAFGKENIVVVKDAKGGEPIRRWYKNWQPATGDEPGADGFLYDQLMGKVQLGMKNMTFHSITFLWMQGERDARESHGEVYAASLQGLFDQLAADLRRDDINFVVGRLSDFDMPNDRYPHWTMVRDAQEEVVASCDRCLLIDTDDLNDGLNEAGNEVNNDLHYSVEGYEIMGERFAEAAIRLIGEAGER